MEPARPLWKNNNETIGIMGTWLRAIPGTPRTSQHYRIVGFKVGLQLGPHCVSCLKKRECGFVCAWLRWAIRKAQNKLRQSPAFFISRVAKSSASPQFYVQNNLFQLAIATIVNWHAHRCFDNDLSWSKYLWKYVISYDFNDYSSQSLLWHNFCRVQDAKS